MIPAFRRTLLSFLAVSAVALLSTGFARSVNVGCFICARDGCLSDEHDDYYFFNNTFTGGSMHGSCTNGDCTQWHELYGDPQNNAESAELGRVADALFSASRDGDEDSLNDLLTHHAVRFNPSRDAVDVFSESGRVVAHVPLNSRLSTVAVATSATLW